MEYFSTISRHAPLLKLHVNAARKQLVMFTVLSKLISQIHHRRPNVICQKHWCNVSWEVTINDMFQLDQILTLIASRDLLVYGILFFFSFEKCCYNYPASTQESSVIAQVSVMAFVAAFFPGYFAAPHSVRVSIAIALNFD